MSTADATVQRLDELVPRLWKNGRGITRLLANGYVNQTDDSQDTEPDWRVSVAEVVEDGAFSIFDGYRRCAMVLSGKGATLLSQGEPSIVLPPFTPVWFDGETPLVAELLSGPISVLNVMHRRNICSAKVDATDTFQEVGSALFKLVLAPYIWSQCRVSGGGKTVSISAGEFYSDSGSSEPSSIQILKGPIATVVIAAQTDNSAHEPRRKQ